jgi:HEAT repeat protein
MLVPVCLLLLASGPAPIDQVRPAAPSPAKALASAPMRGADELAKGWTALAAGRAGDAETIADALLRTGTRRHDALLLKVHARVQAGRIVAALDAYEEALRGAPAEDVYLVQPIARGLLDALSRGSDLGVRILALKALAQAGDRDAAARLGELAAGDQTGAADTALAGLDNPRAIARLEQRIATAGPRADVSDAIDALAKARATSAVKAITGALDTPRPLPTRLSAARALGLLDARDAIPRLQQALTDPDPPVRMMAAAALSRLGDQSGADLLRIMETSPVADVRLMLAEIAAPKSPDGPWVATALKAMDDADPLVRLSAAELVVKYAADPRPGLAVLTGALADANPAMRLAASRELAEVPTPLLGNDLPSLRKWLRDAGPEVRIAAAAAVLRLAGGIE